MDGLEVATGVIGRGKNDEGEVIVDYATYNEYGTDSIPARPFMAMSVDTNKPEIESEVRRNVASLVGGQVRHDTVASRLGKGQVERIKHMITNVNITPKLASSTINAKGGSTKTLIDTGALLASISAVFRRKGK